MTRRLGKRLMYLGPRHLTRPWLPRIFWDRDEWHNPVLTIVLPLLGRLTIWYGSTDDSKWFAMSSCRGIYAFIDPAYAKTGIGREAKVPEELAPKCDLCDWPLPLTEEEIGKYAIYITHLDISDFDMEEMD